VAAVFSDLKVKPTVPVLEKKKTFPYAEKEEKLIEIDLQ
jgi:hypothetical protein